MSIRNFFLSAFLIVGVLTSGFSITYEETTKVRMVINLLDYIAKDYGMAVKDGEVINEFEFAEMQEFSANAEQFYLDLEANGTVTNNPAVAKKFAALNAMIASKSSPAEVSEFSGEIRQGIVELKLVSLAPTNWPDLANGKSVFNSECATCHGITGHGDGALAEGLQPKPSNFHDPEVIDNVSPLQAFNTITLGLDGTSMRAFTELSQKEIWDLSFYVLSLQHQGKEVSAPSIHNFSLEEIATLSNNKLLELDPGLNVASLRTKEQESSSEAIDVASDLLKQSQEKASEGDFEAATTLALKAYLQGVEPVEPRIKASDNQLFEKLESAMMGVRAELKNKSNSPELLATYKLALATIDEAKEVLGSTQRSLLMTAIISISILLREGLEAFFVILAILGILQSMGASRAIRWVHTGWITAVGFGIIGWFFAGSLMTWDAQSRELMEGLIALFAVVVLLYLGFWMHGHSNATKWKAFVETKVKGLLTKNNMLGLASFSFIVVFREAFESVIFLSSLTLDGSSESKIGVFIGFVSSAILLFGIAWAMLKWFKKMPIAKVFLYSSMVILALAFVLSGSGIHALQEGGYIDISSFPLNFKISALGVFPTYQTMLVQLAVLGMILVLWNVGKSSALKPSAPKANAA